MKVEEMRAEARRFVDHAAVHRLFEDRVGVDQSYYVINLHLELCTDNRGIAEEFERWHHGRNRSGGGLMPTACGNPAPVMPSRKSNRCYNQGRPI